MSAPPTQLVDGQHSASAGGWLGDSDMAALVRAFDWSQTTLGAINSWPPALASAIGLCLHSRFQSAVYAGPELLFI